MATAPWRRTLLVSIVSWVAGGSHLAFAQPAPSPVQVEADGGAPEPSDAGTSHDSNPDASSQAAPAAAPEPPPAPPAVPPAPPAMPPPPAVPPTPAKGEHKKEAVSPLVPEVDTRQTAKRPIDPKVTFGQGSGLTIKSADGDFALFFRIRGQILGTFQREHAGEGETLVGAQIRRARVLLWGNWFGEHNKYKMEIAIAPRDSAMRDGTVGTAPLLDWYLTFDYLKPATLVVGQYKVPFNRQRVISSGFLQMVDRSIVQNEFTFDRNVGLDVRSTSLLGGRLHYNAGIYPGEARNAFEVRPGNVIYLGRIELLPFGNFNDYQEADFERTGPRVSVGGSYAHVTNSPRNQVSVGRAPADGGTTTFDTVEADVLLKMYGLSVSGELFWREGQRRRGEEVDESGVPLPTERPRDGFGYFAQLGFLLPHTMFEVTGRYGDIRSSGAKSSLPDRHELGGGVGYYFARHSLKLQSDYFRLWGAGTIAEGTDQVRVQLEAGF